MQGQDCGHGQGLIVENSECDSRTVSEIAKLFERAVKHDVRKMVFGDSFRANEIFLYELDVDTIVCWRA